MTFNTATADSASLPSPTSTAINLPRERRRVVIDSPRSMQNKVLAELIEARTGYPCAIHRADRPSLFASAQQLVLLDAAHCAARLPAMCSSRSFSIALINADERFPCEHVAYPGVKGLFCTDTTEDNLVKGIKAIFDGEYWLPRRLLCAHLERTRSMPRAPGCDATRLTPKEVQILPLLAQGDSTRHIARQLKVSPYTVKTHIYNLFRKIQVSNRVQAAQWASCHGLLADSWRPR